MLETLRAEPSAAEVSETNRAVPLTLAIGLIGLHITLFAAGERSSGPLGPAAGLVLNLIVDASLPVLHRFTTPVTLLTLSASTALSIGDSIRPGLFAAEHPLTTTTVPTATPAIVAVLVSLIPRRQVITYTAALAVLAIQPWATDWESVYSGLSAVVLPAALALYLQARRELLRSLRERAELAERESRLLAEQARTAERQRLAAEMHDVVTHHVTEIVLHAGALGVSIDDEHVRNSAQQIRDAAARTLEELRDLVGVVRGTDQVAARPSRTQETGGDLPQLVAASGAELTVTGDPGQVTPAIARAVYRVVQESLTNARKHAPGAHVCVRASYHPDTVEVTVSNAGPEAPADPALAGSGSGVGLIGLERRITMLGGSFTAAPATDGGFTVAARLPASVPTGPQPDHR